MIKCAAFCLLTALIAAFFGFGHQVGLRNGVAKMFFVVALISFVITVVTYRSRRV